MKWSRPRRLLTAVLYAAMAGLVCSPGCTVGKKRAPGPLVVWMIAEPGSEPMFRSLVDEYERLSKQEVELSLKEPYEIRSLLLNNPQGLEGKVDVVEVDLFDLEDAAPVMEDLGPAMAQLENTSRRYQGAFQAGNFEGKQLLIPWRLSWPVMLSSKRIGPPKTWEALGRVARDNPGQVLVPGLDDREFFAFLCSVVWAFRGDPADPYDPGMFEAFQWLESVAGDLHRNSMATRAEETASLPPDERPLIFFEWPQGLLTVILSGSLQFDLDAYPCPCGKRGYCPTFFFGRYLGMPKQARHPEDAWKFITYMIAPSAQQKMIFGSPWLPVSSTGWGRLGARQAGYAALALNADGITAPPRPMATIKKAMTKAGTMLLIDRATAYDAVNKYRDIMAAD